MVLLVLVFTVLLHPLAAQLMPPTFQLLAFKCVLVDRAQPWVVQLEREGFPPRSGTGLFTATGEQVAYVEQGSLTIFSDQIGKGTGEDGFSFLADPRTTLNVRNDTLATASVLWLRMLPAIEIAPELAPALAPAAYLSPAALRVLRAAAAVGDTELLPLFYEFALPDRMSSKHAYLFMAKLHLKPNGAINPVEGSPDLTKSGSVAVVVESGELWVSSDEMGEQLVLTGDGMVVDGEKPYVLAAMGSAPTEAFLIGVVATVDEGQVGTAIRQDAAQDRHCP